MVDVDCRCKIRNETAFVTLLEFGRHRDVLESSLPVFLRGAGKGRRKCEPMVCLCNGFRTRSDLG
jgi:hypothetical protein